MEVAALTAFLAPFLPYLYRAGQTLVEDAGRKLGAEGWEHAKRLWARLHPSIEDKPAAREAAQELASRPEDEPARAALELQLEKLLEADAGLAHEISQLWEEAKAANVVVAGPRGVAIGRDMTGGLIVTGDHDTIGK